MAELKLLEIVEQSGLEVVEQKTITEKFSDYEAIAKEWEIKAKQIVVTNETQVTEMAMAKTARKKFSDLRIDIEKTRKAMKEQSLRKGQVIDSIANYLKSLVEPIEKYLKEQESFIQIKQSKEAELLKIEAEKKEEAERVAKEKAEREEQEKIRKENENLKLEAEKRDLIEAKRKAEADKKFREEREAKEKAEKDLSEAKELELKKILEAEKAIEREMKLAEETKLKEQQAPDNDKLVKFADMLLSLETPELSSKNSVELMSEVKKRLENISNYIKKEIN